MAEAPRFKFYWERVEGTSVLTMRRQDWDTVVGSLGAPVAFDVRSTPLSGITHTSSVVASVAHHYGNATARISVFRHDADDAPYPINQDKYDVWTDLSAHPRLNEMITAAATSYDENFRNYCQENVFLIKIQPGPDHWLTTLPSSVSLILEST